MINRLRGAREQLRGALNWVGAMQIAPANIRLQKWVKVIRRGVKMNVTNYESKKRWGRIGEESRNQPELS